MKVTITSNGTVQGTHLEVNGVAHEDDDYVVSIEPNGDYPDVTVRFIAG